MTRTTLSVSDIFRPYSYRLVSLCDETYSFSLDRRGIRAAAGRDNVFPATFTSTLRGIPSVRDGLVYVTVPKGYEPLSPFSSKMATTSPSTSVRF
jgi:hypothetical protein